MAVALAVTVRLVVAVAVAGMELAVAVVVAGMRLALALAVAGMRLALHMEPVAVELEVAGMRLVAVELVAVELVAVELVVVALAVGWCHGMELAVALAGMRLARTVLALAVSWYGMELAVALAGMRLARTVVVAGMELAVAVALAMTVAVAGTVPVAMAGTVTVTLPVAVAVAHASNDNAGALSARLGAMLTIIADLLASGIRFLVRVVATANMYIEHGIDRCKTSWYALRPLQSTKTSINTYIHILQSGGYRPCRGGDACVCGFVGASIPSMLAHFVFLQARYPMHA